MKLLFLIVMLCITVCAKAQQKISFSSQNYVGLLEGEQGSKFQLQTINGVAYKTWFVGLGTGIDWYYQRSIPAFASVSKHFFHKASRSFYASLDGGMNYPWKEDEYYCGDTGIRNSIREVIGQQEWDTRLVSEKRTRACLCILAIATNILPRKLQPYHLA